MFSRMAINIFSVRLISLSVNDSFLLTRSSCNGRWLGSNCPWLPSCSCAHDRLHLLFPFFCASCEAPYSTILKPVVPLLCRNFAAEFGNASSLLSLSFLLLADLPLICSDRLFFLSSAQYIHQLHRKPSLQVRMMWLAQTQRVAHLYLASSVSSTRLPTGLFFS